jgi:hypothetical protein
VRQPSYNACLEYERRDLGYDIVSEPPPGTEGIERREGPIAGYATMEVEYLSRNDPKLLKSLPGREPVRLGMTLAELREKIGGNEGYLVGPTGERFFVKIPGGLDEDDVRARFSFKIWDKPQSAGQASETHR